MVVVFSMVDVFAPFVFFRLVEVRVKIGGIILNILQIGDFFTKQVDCKMDLTTSTGVSALPINEVRTHC
jgi:hypothetical protein